MKRLKVPYLAGLDSLDLSSIGFFMESKAQREYINEINWKEYGYKPIVVFDIARSDKYLYLRYFVKGHSIKACFDKDDSSVHKDSCVEFFNWLVMLFEKREDNISTTLSLLFL